MNDTAGRSRYVVLYDGDCAFCTGWRDRMARRDPHGLIEWLSVHDPVVAARYPDLDREDALKKMYVFAPDGSLTKGADGWVVLFSVLERMGWLAILARVPGVKPVMRQVYHYIAGRRYRLSCSTAACRQPRGGSGDSGSRIPLVMLVVLLTTSMPPALLGCAGANDDPVGERLAMIADPIAAGVLAAAFQNYGGYETWGRHRTVEYRYSLKLYAGQQEPVAVSRQIHRFSLREEKAYIEELDVPEPRIMRLDGEALEVDRGGVPVTDPEELEFPRALSRLVRWSFMNPWNLLETGTVLEARAVRTPAAEGAIPSDPCDVVRFRRTEDGTDGGTESDDWHDFYISRLSRLVDRVHSYRADDHSYRISIWSDYWTIGGVRVSTERRVYSSDEFGSLVQLEAIARYRDILFDVPFDADSPDSKGPLAAGTGAE